MPSGTIPSYAYKPSDHPGTLPHLRTCSSLRARLFNGGTYFRAREPGALGNNLSVEVIEYTDTNEGVCVITNYNIKADEMVTGPVKLDFFDVQLSTNNVVVIDQLNTPTPRARDYSISFKIAPPLPTYTDLGIIRALSLVSLPGVLAVKVTPTVPVFTPADVITITPRKRVYRLVSITMTNPDTMLPETGWDIADLRAQVNAIDPWVEMLERSGDDVSVLGPPIPNPNPVDFQDHGTDATFLTPFVDTRLTGGDGIPGNPDQEITGPYRSLVHVNYGELYNGRLAEVNIVYEWNGKNAREGTWQRY